METRQVNIRVLWPDMYEECEECSRRLLDEMKTVKGLDEVNVDQSGQQVTLLYDPERTSLHEILERAKIVGAAMDNDYEHTKMHVVGLDCPDCALKLETSIRRVDGVVWASLNFASSILLIEYRITQDVLKRVITRVRSLGYDIAEEQSKESTKSPSKYNSRILITAGSGILLAAGMLAKYVFNAPLVSNILFLSSAVIGGVHAARYGMLALIGRSLDTNFLMTLAAVGGIALGEYAEAAAVMFLYSLGSALESFTADKTRRSIYSLIDSFPKTAHVKNGTDITEINLNDIQVGQIIIVKPGERIPLDGVVRTGVSDVNESPISGESMPVDKESGSRIFAGSINGFGSLEIVVSSIFSESTVSRVVKLVEDAQSQKAKSQSFSEKFGAVYTPCVIAAAVLVALLGPSLLGGGITHWLHRSLVLLVVACPCALVISTPVAIVAAIGHLASKGVLVKGGIHLETLGMVTEIGFDKTGTLTTGKLRVEDVIPRNGNTSTDVLSIAAAVESRSEHPISDAILSAAREYDVTIPDIAYFKAIAGKGAIAVTSAGEFAVGSDRFMQERGFDTAVFDSSNTGKSTVFVSDEHELIGMITLADSIRPEAAESLATLREYGIKRIVLITGDSRDAALLTAKVTGIDEIHSALLPEQKLEIIKNMSSNYTTAVVGDGINDAPALAAAHVGIALRGLGNEAAVQAADVVLMGDNLRALPYAIMISRKTRKIIFQNTVIALATVGILISGAFAGKVGLAAGVLGHEGSALLVILNSMRLLARYKTSSLLSPDSKDKS